jgi:hypothetical protein
VSYPGHPGVGAALAAAGQGPPVPLAGSGPSSSSQGGSSSSSRGSAASGGSSSSSSSSSSAAFMPPPGWHGRLQRVYILNKNDNKYHVGKLYDEGNVLVSYRGDSYQACCNPREMSRVQVYENQFRLIRRYTLGLDSTILNLKNPLPSLKSLGTIQYSMHPSSLKTYDPLVCFFFIGADFFFTRAYMLCFIGVRMPFLMDAAARLFFLHGLWRALAGGLLPQLEWL